MSQLVTETTALKNVWRKGTIIGECVCM